MNKITTPLLLMIFIMSSCTSAQTFPASEPIATDSPQANLPNPASIYCEQQGYQVEIRTTADGSQTGTCIFPDGSECDEWAYFRSECGPAVQNETDTTPTEIPTAIPIDPNDYQGWWTYTHDEYSFSIMLPEDWIVDEATTFDPQMSGHTLNLHPNYGTESIRMTFRYVEEDVRLLPTGVGQGEFIQQGTLEIAGQPARRFLLVCPTGEVTAIWYHGADDDQPNLVFGNEEFGFIYSAGEHCAPGQSLGGKIQRAGEMIIASLKVP